MANGPSTYAQLIVDTGDSKQNLEEIRQAAVDFGGGAAQAADLFTDRFGQIESGVGRVFDKITQGKAVSDGDLKAVSQQFAQVQIAAEQAFGSIENAPDAVKQAFTVAENQIQSATNAINRIDTAAKQAADAFKQTAKVADTETDHIADGFKLAEKQIEKLTQTVREGSPEMGEQLRRLVGVQINLRKEIEATFGAVDKATPETIAKYRQITATVDQMKTNIGDLTREMQQQTAGIVDQSQAWRGMDAVMNDVVAKTGKMGPMVLGGIAAFREGVQLGAQFNQAVGANMEAWDDFAGSFKSEAGQMLNVTADLNASMLNLLGSLKSFDSDKISSAFSDYQAEMIRWAASIALSTKEEEGLLRLMQEKRPLMEILTTSTKDLATVGENLNKIHAAERLALAGGNEMQKLWNDAKRVAGERLRDQAEAAKQLTPVLEAHAKLMAFGKDGEKLWSDMHVTHATTIEQLREKLKAAGVDLEKLKDYFDKVKKAEDDARSAHEKYLDSLSRTEKAVADMAETLKKDGEAWSDASRKRIQAEGDITRLTSRQADLKRQLEDLNDSFKNMNLTEAESADRKARLTDELNKTTTALDAARSAQSAATEEEKRASAAIDEHRAKREVLATQVKKESDEILTIVDSLNKEAGTRRQLSTEQVAQIERLKQLVQTNDDLSDSEKAAINRYIELMTAKAHVMNANGALIESNLTEQATVRQEVEHLGKEIEKRREQVVGITSTKTSFDDLTTATRSQSAALDDSAGISIKWTNEAAHVKQSAAEAADVMRKLAEQQNQVATDTTSAATATDKAGESLPRLKTAAEQAHEPARLIADTMKNAAEPTQKFADALAALKVPAEVIDSLRTTVGLVGDLKTQCSDLATEAGKAAKAMDALGSAGQDTGAGDAAA